MKRIYIAMTLLLLIGSSCKTTRVSNSSEAEKLVIKFLGYMDHKAEPSNSLMMACISPAYISDNKINIADSKVNNYTIWGFSIVSYYASTGIVVTKIWGEGKSWIHELDFKVVKENGCLYLMPSQFSESYIDPWFGLKSYIKE